MQKEKQQELEIIRDTVLDMRFPGRVITFRLAIEGRAENPW